MRTLDEVIKAFEYTYENDPIAWTYGIDALHYLKEYKRVSAKLEKIALGNITETLEKLDNPALTWDELRSMEGKPIWVEVDYHNPEETYKYWTIVKYFDSNEGGDMVFTGTGFYYKDLLGIDWRAYRKEKNETD